METIKKFEAFKRATEAFGPWRTWHRSQHVAYGLIRGVPYVKMERCSNDIPPTYGIASALAQLGAWPGSEKGPLAAESRKEVEALVVWVRKTPRGKRMRPTRQAPPAASEVA